MEPKSFPEANMRLGPPRGWTDDECGSLEVHDTGEAFISRWEFSEEDRWRISLGAPVWLKVTGRGHPPVSLQTESPFVAEKPMPPGAEPISQLTALGMLLLPLMNELAGAASMCWDPPPGEQVFDPDRARIAACDTAMRVARIVEGLFGTLETQKKLEEEAKLGRELGLVLQEHRAEVHRRSQLACDHARRTTALEDGRTSCKDCGLSLTPVYWDGKLPEGARVTSPDEIQAKVRGMLEKGIPEFVPAVTGELPQGDRHPAGVSQEPPKGAGPVERPWPDDEDLLT